MTLVKFTQSEPARIMKPAYSGILDSLFNPDPLISPNLVSRLPAVNIAETDTEFHLELAAPGLKREDFKINLDKDQLVISAEQQESNSDTRSPQKFNRREFVYNTFTRTFILPESADQNKVEAEYTDGILFIRIAKKEEAKVQAREIRVK